MAARDVLKNFNVYVDGRGYAGQVEEYTPPVLGIQTEDFRGGGMDAPEAIDMGMEKLESSFVLIAYDADVLSLFGFVAGGEIPLTVRGAVQSVDGTVKPVVHNMRGKIRKLDSGSWKPGDKPSLTVELDLHYYRLQHDGRTIHEIDVRNMLRTINGVDQLAEQRRALGL